VHSVRHVWHVLATVCVVTVPTAVGYSAEGSRPTTRPEPPRLSAQIRGVLAHKRLHKSIAAVHVVMIPTGREIFSVQPDRPMIPASNMKLVTTAAAVTVLGREFTFHTCVYLVGRDLVVVGGGDPTIDGRFTDGRPGHFLLQWAQHLKRAGLTRVEGDLVVDDGLFDQEYVHPHWPVNQLHKWYCAPVSALSLNENCIRVMVEPCEDRSQAVVRLAPHLRSVEVLTDDLSVATRAGDHRWGVRRHPTRDQLTVYGAVFQAHDVLVAVHSPPLYFGDAFRTALEDTGIHVAGRVRHQPGVDLDGARLLHTHRSSLLPALVVCNKSSRGFYAEMLLKMLGTRLGRGTWAHGRDVVDRFLRERDLAPEGYRMDDGSGLSRENRLTARQLVGLLLWMAKQPYGDAFRNTLAVGGVDGTLDSRLTNAAVKGRVFGKTGYIAGVRALSVYLFTRRGRWLAASFLFNRSGPHAKHAIDAICALLVENL